jgi:hypothetical protein
VGRSERRVFLVRLVSVNDRSRSRVAQLALLASLVLILVNVWTTGRWANTPGAVRGWRWPFILAAVVLAAVPALKKVSTAWTWPRWVLEALLLAGVMTLAGSFLFDWFPISSWPLVPFLDDWPPRFSSTVEGISLLRRGAFVGWQWHLLGGYATATDITQGLTLLGFIPMTLFGDAVGFHVLHLLLFLAVPALVFGDLRLSGTRQAAAAAAGLVALAMCGLGAWDFMRSGDSNSLAGIAGLLAILAASHRARLGRRYGFSVLVLALTVTVYSHVGFFAYAVGLLMVEAAYYASWRQARLGLLAAACAFVASLPLTYELLRYPAEFIPNNVMYVMPAHIDWAGVLRKIGYDVQINLLPSRWFNDAIRLFGPVVLFAAWRRDGRAGFYAWAAVFVVVLGCFNVPEAGYFFGRPARLLPIFAPIVLAWFVGTSMSSRWQASGVLALIVLLVPFLEIRVPHESSVEHFLPPVVDRLKTLDGALVLVENNPHRDVDASASGLSEPSLYGTHYESLLPAATGKRLYAGYWDGWQWTPFRGEMLAGGAWQGHLLSAADRPAFLAEMQRWGIRHLLVWSATAKAALGSWTEFVTRWEDGPWREFELTSVPIDTRSVVTVHGAADLVSTDPLGGLVRLTGVEAGDRIVVRTHYHPAWQAVAAAGPIVTMAVDGQLGFVAPASGSYDVTLVYPARRWLLVLSALLLAAVVAAERRLSPARAR